MAYKVGFYKFLSVMVPVCLNWLIGTTKLSDLARLISMFAQLQNVHTWLAS